VRRRPEAEGTQHAERSGTAANKVTGTIKLAGTPEYVALSPDGRRAYVSNYNSDSVSVIDTGVG
jgi:DNA-binding beta-propeller fold protein YncE